jgi:hypothetical protein
MFQDRQPLREKDNRPLVIRIPHTLYLRCQIQSMNVVAKQHKLFWQIGKAGLVVDNFKGSYGTKIVLDWDFKRKSYNKI